jgi:hypothetical protein
VVMELKICCKVKKIYLMIMEMISQILLIILRRLRIHSCIALKSMLSIPYPTGFLRKFLRFHNTLQNKCGQILFVYFKFIFTISSKKSVIGCGVV